MFGKNLPAQAIKELLSLYHSIFPDKKLSSEFFDLPQTLVWIQKEDDVLAGFAFVWEVADEGQILDVGVAAEYRRRGIARRMLKEVIAAMESNGIKKLTLEVSEKNKPAVALYKAAGFVVVGGREGYYPDGSKALLMDFYTK